MKKRDAPPRAVLLLFFLAAAAYPVHAQEEPMITVLPFSSIEVPESISQIISQLFETNLVNTGAYSVLSQNERNQILTAQAESLSGCVDEACAIELGRLLSAEQVIIGTVAALGTKYIINAKIIDVTTSKTLGADSISAASIEELDTACHELTISLVQKAMPDAAVAEAVDKEEPAEVVEAPPAEEPAEEVLPVEELAEEEVPDEKPQEAEPTPPKASRKTFPLLGMILTAGGAAMNTTANILSASAFSSLADAEEAYQIYQDITVEPGNYFSGPDGYEQYHQDYQKLAYTSLGLWTLGTAAPAADPFLFDGVPLSFWGRVGYSAGTIFNSLGSLFSLMAADGYMDAWRIYRAYQNATVNPSDFYAEYETEYAKKYETPRSVGIGLWAGGGVLQAAAPFLPGDKRSIGPGLVHKILYSAGQLMILGGNIFSQVSISARADAERKYILYEEASENRDALLADYQEGEDIYKANAYLAGGLWGAGTAFIVTALFLPPPRAADVSRHSSLSWEVVPASVGWGAEIRIHVR